PAVAAAPDLRGPPGRRAEQGDPGVGESRRPLRGPARDIARTAGQGADDGARGVGGGPRPPCQAAGEWLTERAPGWPAGRGRGVEQERAAFVLVALPGRAEPLVEERGGAVDHRAQPLPGGRAQRAVRRVGLDGGDKPQLGDEALVARGELAADARGERVADQLLLQQARGLAPPALAIAEPREGATGHELPGRLGDDVVVRRGAAAPEGGEILLVPAYLLARQ